MLAVDGGFAGCLAGAAVGACVGALWTKKRDRGRSPTRQLTMASEKLRPDALLHPFRAQQLDVTHEPPVSPQPDSPRHPREFKRRISGKFSMNENKVLEQKVVLAMVGLPARGKSYISKAIVRYLNFVGCPTQLFNAGNLRRSAGKSGVDANFFDSSNENAKKLRDELAMECLDQLLAFLEKEGQATAVGILDATNTTLERRRKVKERVLAHAGIRLIFLESICDDGAILSHNYDLKLGNEDYVGMKAEKALQDFLDRVEQYAQVYEPVEDGECSDRCGYIKLINAGEKLICNHCRSKDDEYGVMRYIVGLMSSINLGKRCIMLAVVGETEHDRKGVLGGDSALTYAGKQHAAALARFVSEREEAAGKPMLVMCGTLTRHLQTVEALKAVRPNCGQKPRKVLKLQRLNELCAGDLDSLSYEEFKEFYPEEFSARQRDKLNYRYPGVGGESYQDVLFRLSFLVLRLEQIIGNVLIVCDKAVCRVLLAYYRGVKNEDLPYLDVRPGVMTFERSHIGFTEDYVHKMGMSPAISKSCAELQSMAGAK
ncbi:unnamed protein product [Symbiodinium sp. CCMP2456]|nr:unnamed protein product [Symbiodinium sp. CCMP2456]